MVTIFEVAAIALLAASFIAAAWLDIRDRLTWRSSIYDVLAGLAHAVLSGVYAMMAAAALIGFLWLVWRMIETR